MKTFEITTASTQTESQIIGCFFNAHTCGWLYGCCYVPSPDISPGVEQSVRQQYSGYSWDIHTPCFSTGCTLGQTHPVLAGPQFLEVEIKSFDLYVNYSLVYAGWYWRNNSALLGWRRKERKKKKVCAHQSPSYFLGPCHPGKNSPALLPGGPQSKVPGTHPPPGQTGCPELGPGREEKDTQCCLIALLCFCSEAIQPHVCRYNVHFQVYQKASTPLYLQLAVVQAGHWNLLHFHLPELPDEQTLLWSCCSSASIGQNRAAAGGIHK